MPGPPQRALLLTSSLLSSSDSSSSLLSAFLAACRRRGVAWTEGRGAVSQRRGRQQQLAIYVQQRLVPLPTRAAAPGLAIYEGRQAGAACTQVGQGWR